MKRYDIIIKYHDRQFRCKAEFKAQDCSKSPFTPEHEKQIEEFEKELGEIESITIKLKK